MATEAEPAQIVEPATVLGRSDAAEPRDAPTSAGAGENQTVAEAQEDSTALTAAQWGSIGAVLNEPLIDVPHDAWWISALGMWLFILPVLLSGIISGLFPTVYVCISIGTCCIPCSHQFCSIMGHVLRGRPLWTAWTMWRGMVATLTALIKNKHSRLALFEWEWKAFGSGRWFWHGEGIWCMSYEDCNRILQGPQERQVAFGAVKAPAPDLYAAKLLIFLPNSGPESEWAAVRRVLHQYFLDHGLATFKSRMAAIPDKLDADWKEPKLEDLSNLALVRTAVSKCIFFMFFGVWIDQADATILAKWRDNAPIFILPRLVQRLVFNLGINRVKKLREQCVGLVEKHNKQHEFVRLNDSLGPWKRDSPVRLCDEILFAVGFAGIGGTCAAVESVGAFLQVSFPKESPGAKYIKWGDHDTSDKMVHKFTQNPERYIRETCRLDPPVTSATTSLSEDTVVTLAGKEFTLPKGTLNQYVLSIANRDPVLFPEPDLFNPDRENLEKALTWNGAFGAANEESYPRICPGRHMSLQIAEMVVSHALALDVPQEVAV